MKTETNTAARDVETDSTSAPAKTKVLSETDSERLGLAFYRAIGAVIDANPDVDPWDLGGALGKAVHVLDTNKDRLCRHAVARAATYETEESVAHAMYCAIGEVLNNHIDRTWEESSTAVGTAIRVLAQFGVLKRELVSQAAASDEPMTSLLSGVNVRPRVTVEDFLAERREAGCRIDPKTAVYWWTKCNGFDPYRIHIVFDDEQVMDYYGHQAFARAPLSDICVAHDHLPEETRAALMARTQEEHEAAYLAAKKLEEAAGLDLPPRYVMPAKKLEEVAS